MAKKKEGFISKEEEEALRENAKIVSEQSRGMFQNLVPHRIDSKTVVLVNPICFDKPILNVKGKLGFWDYESPELKPSNLIKKQ